LIVTNPLPENYSEDNKEAGDTGKVSKSTLILCPVSLVTQVLCQTLKNPIFFRSLCELVDVERNICKKKKKFQKISADPAKFQFLESKSQKFEIKINFLQFSRLGVLNINISNFNKLMKRRSGDKMG
jgi:hypothetical protein